MTSFRCVPFSPISPLFPFCRGGIRNADAELRLAEEHRCYYFDTRTLRLPLLLPQLWRWYVYVTVV